FTLTCLLQPQSIITSYHYPDNNRHIFQTVGPCCCAAIMPGGAAPIDREQAAPPYQSHRLSLGIDIIRCRLQFTLWPPGAPACRTACRQVPMRLSGWVANSGNPR